MNRASITMRIVALAATPFALAACGSTGEPTGSVTATAEPPTNYRQVVAAKVKETFFDPYTIRDAEIAPPKRAVGPSLNSDGFTTPWIVCVRANAKNRMGAYTGRSVTAFGLSNGQVVNSWDEAHYSKAVCDGVAYEPFPEIVQADARR